MRTLSFKSTIPAGIPTIPALQRYAGTPYGGQYMIEQGLTGRFPPSYYF